jgi:hypothetical protein
MGVTLYGLGVTLYGLREAISETGVSSSACLVSNYEFALLELL